MKTMRAMQVIKAKGNFELRELPVPEPTSGHVRIKVQACGICHSDMFVKEGLFPGIKYPRTPGHEIIGWIDAIGPGVTRWKPGDRVGVGWHGGHCFTCDNCRHGDFITCKHAKVAGLTFDGGYAEYMVVGEEALALAPRQFDALEAAPLMCAGVTTFNALRNSGARWGDLVAIAGIGGLGHLGVQYARKMGFRTVAISNSESKRDLAARLGAHIYIDASKASAAEELTKLGGARVILATAPDAKSTASLVNGLGVHGQLVMVGVSGDPIEVTSLQLIAQNKTILGWPSGDGMDSQETLEFSALTGVTAMVERFELEKANEAYARMLSNQARFRAVLAIG
ncbi:MAG: alcohol dehydrogenase catalytic domain-containing protein [Phycisphaerae bacterium]|nr:alcohol dehydrogenase catalytic domain-containing protein [Phycisphaerae bacterium]